MIINAISNTISKHDLTHDQALMAISAWRATLKILSANYNQREHQAALLVVKSICQNLVRKLDALISSDKKNKSRIDVTNSRALVPLKIMIRSLVECM